MNTSKNRSKYIAVVLAAAAFGASCTDEVPAIPDSELYTREWVKAFGAINPNQDWNTAAAGSVNVTTDAPATVRVTAVIQGTNYLLANYSDVSGSRCLTFDIPKGVKEVTVSCGNERVKTTLGGNVSFATSGRAVNNGAHGSNPTVTIETLSGDHSYLTLTKEEVQNYRKTLPEIDNYAGDYYEDTNLGKVTQNFRASAKEFYLFPQYWWTHSYSVNRYGIYYYVTAAEMGQEGVNEVKDIDGNTHYIKKIHIFDGLITQLQKVVTKTVWKLADQNYAIVPYFNKLMELYPERYKIAEGNEESAWGGTVTAGNHILISEEGSDKWIELEKANDFPKIFKDDLLATFEELSLGNWAGISFSAIEELNNYRVDNPDLTYDYLRSTGVHVKFTDESGELVSHEFGFYIDATSNLKTLYSEARLNETMEVKHKETGEKEIVPKCFMATFKDGLDTEGNEKRYLCFEDYYTQTNYDLNDVVFRVYGFDKFRPDLPDKPDDGDIIDDDDPKTPKWIIACEDLGNKDDFDFNDVVFQVEYTAGESKATITPLAAGGTLETYLCRTGHTDAHIGNEWHQNFVGGGAHTQMLNTYAGQSMLPGIPFTITVDPDNFRLAPNGEAGYQENMGGFFLEVVKDDGAVKTITPPVLKETSYSEAPQMILIFEPEGKPWCWPKERINIRDAYNSKGNPTFLDWVGKNLYDASDKGGNWSEYPTGSGYVIKR